MNFTECDTCRKKPGAAALCAGCLSNRREIARLTDDAIAYGRHADRVKEQRAADRNAFDKLQVAIVEWRRNYRATFQALYDENNTLRETASELAARNLSLEMANKIVARRRWWSWKS